MAMISKNDLIDLLIVWKGLCGQKLISVGGWGRGQHSTILLPDPAAPGLIPRIPEDF
jgi:hypothetical protein